MLIIILIKETGLQFKNHNIQREVEEDISILKSTALKWILTGCEFQTGGLTNHH